MLEATEDLTNLSYLNEGGVLNSIKTRYADKGQIYVRRPLDDLAVASNEGLTHCSSRPILVSCLSQSTLSRQSLYMSRTSCRRMLESGKEM